VCCAFAVNVNARGKLRYSKVKSCNFFSNEAVLRQNWNRVEVLFAIKEKWTFFYFAHLSQQPVVHSWVFFPRGIQIDHASKSRRRSFCFYCGRMSLFPGSFYYFSA